MLLVDHPDFPLDEIAAHAPLVLDTKGVLRPREFTGETLRYRPQPGSTVRPMRPR